MKPLSFSSERYDQCMDVYRSLRERCATAYGDRPLTSRNTFVSDGFPEAGGGGVDAQVTTGTAPTPSIEEDDGGDDPDPEPERRRRPPRRRITESTATPTHLPALLLTLPDVLDQCRLSRSQIYALVSRGEFPEPIKIGKSARWLARELEAWLEGQIAKRGRSYVPLAKAPAMRGVQA